MQAGTLSDIPGHPFSIKNSCEIPTFMNSDIAGIYVSSRRWVLFFSFTEAGPYKNHFKKKELPHEVLIPSCQYISWWSSSNLSEHVRTKPGQVVAGTVSYPPEQGLSKDQVFELLKVPICSSACWAEKLCLAPQKC